MKNVNDYTQLHCQLLKMPHKGGELVIPVPFLSLVSSIVCKKIVEAVLEDNSSDILSSIIKGHDTVTHDLTHDLVQQALKIASEKEGETDDEPI